MRRCMVLVGLVACYSPNPGVRCQQRCTGSCPAPLVCGENGICHEKGSALCDGLVDEPDAAPAIDAAPGCFGRSSPPFFTICPTDYMPTFAASRTYGTSGSVINTDMVGPDHCTFTMMQPNNGGLVCVVLAGQITVAQGVTVNTVGSRPLVMLGTNGIEILSNAAVRASPQGVGNPPNANQPCPGDSSMNGENSPGDLIGAGGAAGGSFQGLGGRGGRANGGTVLGGSPNVTLPALPYLRGGCRGGTGGRAGAFGAAGGSSGGAVYLMTGGTLRIVGTIDASGGHSADATNYDGGGGGGSGGTIVLDAKAVNVEPVARIFARGAGGGAGANDKAGSHGSAPTGPGPLEIGRGGTMFGGAGGDGSGTLGGKDGAEGLDGAGGGGGGGGAGFIYASRSITNASPPPILAP